MGKRKDNWQGMNWCHPPTRLAIYIRDGFCCLWCNRGVEGGIKLSLDHRKPVEKGGGNDPSNLFTACTSCNYARKDKSVPAFAQQVARSRHLEPFVETVARKTVLRIKAAVRRRLPREKAREILRQRKSVAEAIKELSPGDAA